MKPSPCIFIALLILGCAPSGNNDSETTDSLALADTMDVPSLPDDETYNTSPAGDTSQLASYYEAKAQATADQEGNFFRVTIETSQYEATSHVTWFFDKSFSPRLFSQSWAAEGNEGSMEYFVEDGQVVCASQDDGYESFKWCTGTGGTRSQLSGDNNQTTTELLPDTFGAECNESVNVFLNTLIQILKDGQVTNPGESTYSLKIERPFEEDSEFVETVEVSIEKALYEKLVE